MGGAKVEGQLLCFASITFDFPLLTFENRTIVDGASINGHAGSLAGLVIEPTRVAGTVHNCSVMLAGTDASLCEGNESGPYRVIIQNAKRIGTRSNSTTISFGGDCLCVSGGSELE